MNSSEMNSIVFYIDQYEAVKELTDEQLGRLFRAVFENLSGGSVEVSADIKIAYNFIVNQVKKDKEKYEETCRKRAEAGRRGGAPKGNQNAKQAKQANGCSDKQKQAKTSKNKQNKLNDNDNDNENDNDSIRDNVGQNPTPQLVEDVILFMNEVCGTQYRASSKKTKALIKARVNEGFELDAFKTVILKKAREWLGDPKMSVYLRPETLFGTKFEGYLNQPEIIPQTDLEKDAAQFRTMAEEWAYG